MATKYWLMKSEPEEFGIPHLERLGESFWDGVRNYQVRNMFRDEMRVGDRALFYHSSTKDIGVVGEMEIVKVAQVDPTQFDSRSKYYDPKATKDNPRWIGPVVRFISKFPRLVTLDEIRVNPIFSTLPLVKKGNRLSVVRLSKKQYQALTKMGNSKIS